MLYRADFMKQGYVPGNIEQNNASLSKVIGTCSRQLPLDEKRAWEKRAKERKSAHKVRFPAATVPHDIPVGQILTSILLINF
ncbi:hypothetical protein GALMADRAFT_932709 [Galerina marginata CBS 339.88]|uniref:HMG box domain-containing protein n=1 Tax=Galerina marginata (strain CBS 339.88) TaxID=685588 RepID=A0A067SQH7_GALM3|nr:hypothetical protein GALMADRAFT_932709 [Galerina marginata CBS 339.88]